MLKKILISGSNGYIGRHLSLTLKRDDTELYFTDIHEKSLDGDYNYIQTDIRNIDSLSSILDSIDIIYYFTGMTGTGISFNKYKDFVEVNEIGLLNILDYYVTNPRKIKIIFPSTRLVYRGKKNKALLENSPKEFKTVYAMTKFASENYLMMYQKLYNISFTILRICVPFGDLINNDLSYGTINHFISKAILGKDIEVYGDGLQKRTLIHIEDLTEIIKQISLLSKSENQIYNIGGCDTMTIKEIAEHIAKSFMVRVIYKDWPSTTKIIESGDTIFDSTKINRILNYCFKHNFHSWLKSLNSN